MAADCPRHHPNLLQSPSLQSKSSLPPANTLCLYSHQRSVDAISKDKPENSSFASIDVSIDSNLPPRRLPFNIKNKPEHGSSAPVVVLIDSNILRLRLRGGMIEIFKVNFVVALLASHSDTHEQ
jgi:hypothetical protein